MPDTHAHGILILSGFEFTTQQNSCSTFLIYYWYSYENMSGSVYVVCQEMHPLLLSIYAINLTRYGEYIVNRNAITWCSTNFKVTDTTINGMDDGWIHEEIKYDICNMSDRFCLVRHQCRAVLAISRYAGSYGLYIENRPCEQCRQRWHR